MIHSTAEISPQAEIGEDTKIWHQAQVREGARIGRECVIGKGAYIGVDVVVGDRVKIQNGAQIYRGATLEDGVFIGPNAILTNDKYPRAITKSGELKTDADWKMGQIVVKHGASVGAGAIVLPDVTIGRFAMVGAGAVVTRDVPDYRQAMGNPARLKKCVVFTNGHFDLLHAGHVDYLQKARELGDTLIVGLNSDASTRALRGENRPIVPQDERARMLEALACVDCVIIFEETTANNVVEALKPDIYVKGGDWNEDNPPPEAEIVKGYGGRVCILPYLPEHSTTGLIETIIRRYR